MTTTQATAHALVEKWKTEGGMLESVLCLLITTALDEARGVVALEGLDADGLRTVRSGARERAQQAGRVVSEATQRLVELGEE